MIRNFLVDEPSRVAEVRRAVAQICDAECLGETSTGNASLVTTEVCTNILKHAKRGEVFLSSLSERSGPGIEILGIDRGPGMADVSQCMLDGYSSTNTSGTGLGAVARLSQYFDIYSDERTGTVLVARVQSSSRAPSGQPWVGAVLKPIDGEGACGDSWAFSNQEGAISIIVADGLGHGTMAARASLEATAAFRSCKDFPPLLLLRKVHESLRGTRGAAVAIASLEKGGSLVRYAGVGNVVGALISAGKSSLMVSHNGTAGYYSPRFQEFSYPLDDAELLVMHSDGLFSNWRLDRYPGLQRRDPSVIAGVLYRDFARHRDDVCVVVARTGGLP